jgi:release factor glutamine methyltransferase
MKLIQDYLKSNTIDIRELLCFSLNKTPTQLITHSDYALTQEEKSHLDSLIQRRKMGEPFAYITGKKGFYHLDFIVTPATLIPRPETELLIDIAHRLFAKNQAIKLLDLGTGSGVIAITLADKNPHWQVSASDNSVAALHIAKKNTTHLINFQHSYWFDAFKNQRFDLIVSNPPYIKQEDAHLKDLKFEPLSALCAGKDGLDDIRIIIENAPNYLSKNGYLLLEHGFDQQSEITTYLSKNFHNISVFKDNNSNERAVLAQLN